MAKGTAIINFGASPGSTKASIAVTGQGAILVDAFIEVFVMREATADHSVGDHSYMRLLTTLEAGDIIAGTGFTIYARSLEPLEGTFNLRWVWSAA